MGIRRYTATKDNTITNAFESNLITRGTGSNMGLADSLEVFSIYAQANSSSNEQCKFLVQFPVTTSDSTTPNSLYTIQGDRTAGKIPASGSVEFYLRIFNVATDQTLPRDFTLIVSPVSQSWEEGYGLDMEGYLDITYNRTGSNWIKATGDTNWADKDGQNQQGGSFLSASWMGSGSTYYDEFNFKQTYSEGTEDLEIKITGLVEKWIATGAADFSNYGVGVMLTGSEASGSQRSYYTKKFSARESEYFFKRPIIEARWDNTTKDQRGNFYISSSNLSATNNLNTLYIYNYVRGQPTDIDTVSGNIYVNVFTSASAGLQLTTTPNQPVTGGRSDTGIYTASFALSTTASLVYDRWFSGSTDPDSATYYHTGSFRPKTFDASDVYLTPRYVTTMTNLLSEYYNGDVARMRLFTRMKDWSPTIYTVASKAIENSFIENAYYKVIREIDDSVVIAYGTGSDNHTLLSYDATGSYFDLDMKLLEPKYSYGIKFLFYINGVYEEQPEIFRFRIKE